MRNLKRALSLGLTAAMISGLMVMGSSAASYADVTSENNQEAIDVLQAVGIMVGDENGDFNPDQNVTRNEMAVIMSNLMEYNVATYANTSPFTDVPSWAEPYVAACWTNGITAGTSDTTYGGGNDVTTAQAALMLMKALGYFQYQQDFGSDWQLATTRQGNAIDLFDGVDAGVTEPLTRDDVAQLVLNTLTSGMVTPTTSGSITVGGVTIANSVEYNYVTSNAGYARSISDEMSTTDQTDATASIVELGEDLYQGDLARDWDALDAFGRPSAIWSYLDNEIGTYVNDRTATWTTLVSERDLYRAAGTTAVDNYGWNIYVDGQLVDRTTYPNGYDLDRNDTERWMKTGDGVVTEMFVDTVSESVYVTMINTYVAEVTRVEADETEGDYNVTVTMKTRPEAFTTNREFNSDVEYTRGDIVIVGVADGVIETMALAETVEGTVSAVKANDYLTIDGSPYDYNYAYATDGVVNTYTEDNRGLYDLENSVPANPRAGDEVVLYLDASGCLVAVAEAGNVAEDYIYVSGIHQAYGDNSAKVVHYDGTTETKDIDEVDDDTPTVVDDLTDEYDTGKKLGLGVYKYRGSSEYDLTSRFYTDSEGDYEYAATFFTEGEIENGRARMTGQEQDTPANKLSFNVDSNTVFVVVEDDVAFVGYENVPTMKSTSTPVEGWVVVDGKTDSQDAQVGVADIVFITSDVTYEVDNDSFFVVASTGAEESLYDTEGNDTLWSYTVYIEGVEETLVASTQLNVDEIGVYKIVSRDSDGYVADVDQVVTAAEIRDFGASSDAYAEVGRNGGLTLNDPDKSDKSDPNNAVYNERFTITSETMVLVAYMKDNNVDIDTVEVGDIGDINQPVNGVPTADTSAVYVLNVDDIDETAPVAKLILVVNPGTEDETPDGPDFSGGDAQELTMRATVADVEEALKNGDVVIKSDWIPAPSDTLTIPANTTLTIQGNFDAMAQEVIIDAANSSTLAVQKTFTTNDDRINYNVDAGTMHIYTRDDKNSGDAKNIIVDGAIDVTSLVLQGTGNVTLNGDVYVENNVRNANTKANMITVTVKGHTEVGGDSSTLINWDVLSDDTLIVRGTVAGNVTVGGASSAGRVEIGTMNGDIVLVYGTITITEELNSKTISVDEDVVEATLILDSGITVSNEAAENFAGNIAADALDGNSFTVTDKEDELTADNGALALDFLSEAAGYTYQDEEVFGSYTVSGNSVTIYVDAKGDDLGNKTGRDTMIDATARFLGALYRIDNGDSVSEITYDGDAYTWVIPEDSGDENLTGSNWRTGEEEDLTTLTRAIFGTTSDDSDVCPPSVTLTINNEEITLNLVFADGIDKDYEWSKGDTTVAEEA